MSWLGAFLELEFVCFESREDVRSEVEGSIAGDGAGGNDQGEVFLELLPYALTDANGCGNFTVC